MAPECQISPKRDREPMGGRTGRRSGMLASPCWSPLTDLAALIAIAVTSQESILRATSSTNRPNADGDAGPFQQRTLPGWYGTLAQVTNSTYGANRWLCSEGDRAACADQPRAFPA